MSKTNTKLGGGGFHHVCIKTREWDKTMHLYEGILGFTPKITWNAAPKRAVMLDTGDGNYLEVFEDLGFHPGKIGSIFHFALRTSCLDAVIEAVRAAGGTITMEPKDLTIATTNGAGGVPVRIAFFEGPSGESIELFQNTVT